jgi:hypothetical protein
VRPSGRVLIKKRPKSSRPIGRLFNARSKPSANHKTAQGRFYREGLRIKSQARGKAGKAVKQGHPARQGVATYGVRTPKQDGACKRVQPDQATANRGCVDIPRTCSDSPDQPHTARRAASVHLHTARSRSDASAAGLRSRQQPQPATTTNKRI